MVVGTCKDCYVTYVEECIPEDGICPDCGGDLDYECY